MAYLATARIFYRASNNRAKMMTLGISIHGIAMHTTIMTPTILKEHWKNQFTIIGTMKSPTLRSLEKRLAIRPTGFVSKKSTVPRTRDYTIL